MRCPECETETEVVDRLRGLGNAIVPQVAAEILRCMMRVDSLHNARMKALNSYKKLKSK